MATLTRSELRLLPVETLVRGGRGHNVITTREAWDGIFGACQRADDVLSDVGSSFAAMNAFGSVVPRRPFGRSGPIFGWVIGDSQQVMAMPSECEAKDERTGGGDLDYRRPPRAAKTTKSEKDMVGASNQYDASDPGKTLSISQRREGAGWW